MRSRRGERGPLAAILLLLASCRSGGVDSDVLVSRQVWLVDADGDGAFDRPPLVATRQELDRAGLDRYELWDSRLGPR